jgi:hypothetical protein
MTHIASSLFDFLPHNRNINHRIVQAAMEAANEAVLQTIDLQRMDLLNLSPREDGGSTRCWRELTTARRPSVHALSAEPAFERISDSRSRTLIGRLSAQEGSGGMVG